MFKSIKNLTNAALDITVVAAKEACRQVTSANDCCADVTGFVAWKAGQIRKAYESRLAMRQSKMLALEYIPMEQIK